MRSVLAKRKHGVQARCAERQWPRGESSCVHRWCGRGSLARSIAPEASLLDDATQCYLEPRLKSDVE